jgi:hypothetical protein
MKKQPSYSDMQTPEGWKAAVLEITDKELRRATANIIWWDYFGRRTVSERWPHLDAFIGCSENVYVDPREIRDALVQCGYPFAVAARRMAHG